MVYAGWSRALSVAVIVLVALLAWRSPCSIVNAGSTGSGRQGAHSVKLSLTAPVAADAGTPLVFVVHTDARIMVRLHASFESSAYTRKERTGKHGRASFVYMLPDSAQPGTLRVTARAVVAGHHLAATKTVSVRSSFVPHVGVQGVQVLRDGASGWEPATQVRLGEDVRFVASYGVSEPAGNFFPSCISGTLRVTKSSVPVFTASVSCPTVQPENGLPYVYVDTRFSDPSNVGTLDVEFNLTYPEGQYGVAHGVGTTHFYLLPAPDPVEAGREMPAVSPALPRK